MENLLEEFIGLIGRLIARRHVRQLRANAPPSDAATAAGVDGGGQTTATDGDSPPVASVEPQHEPTRP